MSLRLMLSYVLLWTSVCPDGRIAYAGELRAGVAKVDITDYEAGPVHDPMYAKALVLTDETTMIALVSVDAVAIGEIGRISNDYLPEVRAAAEGLLGIAAPNLVVNASHCHGIVRPDAATRTIEALRKASEAMVAVRIGAGSGQEARISENRRFLLKSGRTVDSRQAYSLPADEEFAGVGPIDPEIGILKIERLDGTPLAVVFNFACHPIQGVPSGANTADLSGLAATAIEESLGHDCIALFVQGCGGDINPVGYKDVDHPADARPLGNQLALSTLKALPSITTRLGGPLEVKHDRLQLPRANFAARAARLKVERERLLNALRGTDLNLKTYLPLAVKYKLSPDYPSYYAHGYLHEAQQQRSDLKSHDAANRRRLHAYTENIYIMERLTRLQTNLQLLEKHQRKLVDQVVGRELSVEVQAVRIGDYRLVTFPGELTVEIGLGIKAASPHEHTYVAGYTNGYIYYAPTSEQLQNPGYAQEDCDTWLGAGWQERFEARALELLK